MLRTNPKFNPTVYTNTNNSAGDITNIGYPIGDTTGSRSASNTNNKKNGT